MIIFFDLDGTLIDSTKPIITSLRQALSEHNFDFSDEFIKNLIGMPVEEMFAKFGVSEQQVADIVRLYRKHYKEHYMQGTSLLNGAKEAVELASEYAKVGLVTTKAAVFAKEILNNFNILKHFSVIVGGDEVSKCKPDPEPILKALSRLANSELLSKSELEKLYDFKQIYMIGDTLNDTLSAKAAGIKPYVTLFEYTEAKHFSPDDELFNTPLECVKNILKINKILD